MHNHSVTWLDTGTSVKNGGVKLLFKGPKPALMVICCNHQSVFYMSVKFV